MILKRFAYYDVCFFKDNAIFSGPHSLNTEVEALAMVMNSESLNKVDYAKIFVVRESKEDCITLWKIKKEEAE